MLVAVQRGTNKEFSETPEETNGEPSNEDTSKIDTNLLYRVLRKQVLTLRHEMEESRKSAEEAAKHPMPSDHGKRLLNTPRPAVL